MGSQDQKESTLCLAPCNGNQARNKTIVGRIYGALNPPATLHLCKPLNTLQHPTETLFGTNIAQPKAAVTTCQKAGARYTEGICLLCWTSDSAYTALCQATFPGKNCLSMNYIRKQKERQQI